MSRGAALAAFSSAPPTLAGRFAALRDWAEQDVPMLVEAFGVEDIVASMRPPAPSGVRGAREWVSTRRAMPSFGRGAAWAIVADGDGAARGSVELRSRDPARRVAEVGYWLLPAARGRGFAREAVALACDWALAQPQIDRIVAIVDSGNEPSQRLVSALGFGCSTRTTSNEGWRGDWLVYERSA